MPPNGADRTSRIITSKPQEEEYSLRDFLTVVFKRKRLILSFFVTTVVVTTLGTFLSPPTYEAMASILVKKASAEVPLVPKESSQLIINQVTEEDLNSEMTILKSRQAIEDTLHSLGVDETWRKDSLPGSAWRGLSTALGAPRLSYFDEMVLQLEKKIDVKPIRKSNVLEVTYRNTDPDWATKVVQGLTERYLARRAQVYQSPQAVAFFDEETREAAARLSKAEQALKTYSSQAGVSVLGLSGDPQSLAAEKEAVLRRLADFETQLGEARVQIEQQMGRVTALETQLAGEPERLRSSLRLNQDPTTEELEKALVALYLKRDALVQDFKPDNRKVRDVDQQIQATQERLKEAEAQVASINRTEINKVNQDLKTLLLAAQADLRGARARHDSLQAQVAIHRRALEELDQKGFITEGLRREAKAAEDAYMLYQKKHEEARISAAMDQQKIVNVSIAQPAQRPLKPVAPRKALNLLLGVLLGALGGLGLAFVTEYFDHSLTTGRDLELRVGIPLLGAIPDEPSLGHTS
jgi:succinoglycan biosynthesis transport protein ExoP